jgi:hypothetical protein
MEIFSVGFITSHIGFLLVGLFLWGLIIASGLLLIWGLLKKSWKSLLISGLAFLIPSITLSTQQGWFRLFLLLPLIAFSLAFYEKKTTAS